MVDLDNIKQHSVNRPVGRTLFGSAEEFDRLPQSHKDQIFFLNNEADKYIYELVSSAGLVTGESWKPFEKGNFKIVEEYAEFSDDATYEQKLKKWLYHRGIPFKTCVFILPSYNDYPVYTTWKMVIKYAKKLFFADDITVFDHTFNWCLFYFHEDYLFFGKDNVYDPTDDYKRMEQINEVKKKYPQFKLPY